MKSRIAKKNGQQNSFDDFPDKFFIQEDNDENDIFHKKSFIGTELGGEGNRLRYYAIISTNADISLSEKQKKIINDTFTKICQKYDSHIETIESFDRYALIKQLVPMDVAIGNVLDEGILSCNQRGNFLRSHYYVTNVKKPTTKDIQRYLQNAARS